MSVGLDEWYKQVWEKVHRIEEMLEILIAQKGVNLSRRVEEAEYTTEEEAEVYEAVEEPRFAIQVKDTASNEDMQTPFTDLPEDVQRGVSMAKTMGQMYQVYRDEGGSYRLVTTQEVVDRLARE